MLDGYRSSGFITVTFCTMMEYFPIANIILSNWYEKFCELNSRKIQAIWWIIFTMIWVNLKRKYSSIHNILKIVFQNSARVSTVLRFVSYLQAHAWNRETGNIHLPFAGVILNSCSFPVLQRGIYCVLFSVPKSTLISLACLLFHCYHLTQSWKLL